MIDIGAIIKGDNNRYFWIIHDSHPLLIYASIRWPVSILSLVFYFLRKGSATIQKLPIFHIVNCGKYQVIGGSV